MGLTRRHFLESAALAALARQALAIETDSSTGMPTRRLGRTGERVSILGLGGGSRFLAYKGIELGHAALDAALASGIYGDGQSEKWIGEYLRTRKKNFFLVTKVEPRKADDAMRIVEQSLKNFGLAQVDLLHIHGLGDEADLAAIEAPDGVLKLLYKLREQKVARFIGVSCHQNPQVLKTALERHDFDSTQMALNIAQIGNAKPSDKAGEGMTGVSGFEAVAMPVALKKGMGLTAMKVFGQDKLVGKAAPEMLIRYAMSLPICAAVVGMPKLEFLHSNIAVAKSFRPLSKEEMQSLPQSVSAQMRASIDRFFLDHVDC
jgi:predicted aldo/keto reductase-like oxidoreductase